MVSARVLSGPREDGASRFADSAGSKEAIIKKRERERGRDLTKTGGKKETAAAADRREVRGQLRIQSRILVTADDQRFFTRSVYCMEAPVMQKSKNPTKKKKKRHRSRSNVPKICFLSFMRGTHIACLIKLVLRVLGQSKGM